MSTDFEKDLELLLDILSKEPDLTELERTMILNFADSIITEEDLKESLKPAFITEEEKKQIKDGIWCFPMCCDSELPSRE